jgi:hypothetical protein
VQNRHSEPRRRPRDCFHGVCTELLRGTNPSGRSRNHFTPHLPSQPFDMLSYLNVCLALSEGLLALGCFIAACGRPEAAEKNIQDKFAEFWIHNEDARSDPTSMNRYLMGCARLSEHVLTSVFGPRYLSGQALGVSLCYSVASYLLILQPPQLLLSGSAWIFLCGAAGTLAWIVPSRYSMTLAVLVPGSYLVADLLRVWATLVDVTHFVVSAASFVFAIISACVLDLVWIVLNRKFMRFLVNRHWTIPLMVGLVTSAVIIAMSLSPFVEAPFSEYAYNSLLLFNLLLFLSVLLSTRLLIVLVSSVFFASMIAGALYWFCRPVLSPIAYAAQRYGLQKPLLALGSVLVADAWNGAQWAIRLLEFGVRIVMRSLA